MSGRQRWAQTHTPDPPSTGQSWEAREFGEDDFRFRMELGLSATRARNSSGRRRGRRCSRSVHSSRYASNGSSHRPSSPELFAPTEGQAHRSARHPLRSNPPATTRTNRRVVRSRLSTVEGARGPMLEVLRNCGATCGVDDEGLTSHSGGLPRFAGTDRPPCRTLRS